VHGPKNDLKELKNGQHTHLMGFKHQPNYLDTLKDANDVVGAQ
jgi:hypothetical protein